MLTDQAEQEMGVPQASIWLVTLFSAVKDLTAGTECSLFADDFAISYMSLTVPLAKGQLQQCSNQLQIWADKNGFAFSKTKMVSLHCCNPHGHFLDPLLVLNGSPIPGV